MEVSQENRSVDLYLRKLSEIEGFEEQLRKMELKIKRRSKKSEKY
jgi:hypothetical protein